MEKDKKNKGEGLLSKKNRKLLIDPLSDNNPITVQVLGICSALAVTSSVDKAVIMTFGVIVVCAMSNFIISLLRRVIPSRIRMIVQLVVVAFMVSLVSEVLEAFVYDIFKLLAVFIGLIITNCIIMGRLEAFALGNRPWPSFLDGVGNGIGYGIILIIVSAIREIFGSGTLTLPYPTFGNGFSIDTFKIPLFNNSYFNLYELTGYQNNGLMVLPIASILLIGLYIWLQRSANKKLIDIS